MEEKGRLEPNKSTPQPTSSTPRASLGTVKPPKGIKKKYLNTGIRPIAQQSQEVIKSDSESEAYYLSSENSTQQETESCLDNIVTDSLHSALDHIPPQKTGTVPVFPTTSLSVPTSNKWSVAPAQSFSGNLSARSSNQINIQNSGFNSYNNSPVSSPTFKSTRRSRSATPSNKSRTRSPLLGISAFAAKKGSQI